MANFLRRLLGKNGPANTSSRDAAGDTVQHGRASSPKQQPNTNKQPSASAGSEAAPTFVCREPVLGRDKRISGYQFSLPEAIELRLQNDYEFLPRIYDDAVLRNLTTLGDDALLGPRLTFVRLSPDSLDNPRLHDLPRENTVLMLAPVHRTFDAGRIQQQLDALRQAGVMYGWVLRQTQVAQFPALSGLAAGADFVQVDVADFDAMEVKLLLKSLAAMRPAELPKPGLIAGGLNAVDEFHSCVHAGFDFFLGQFLNRRENWLPPKSNLNRVHIIKLLNLLRSDAEVPIIAQELKLDPVLAFKLLRYINSPLMGLLSPVVSLDKALILLGREKIYRWLSLLLFIFKAPGFEERILTEQALSRAHFLEHLADQGDIPSQADPLFILGLFSVLDQLMGQSMAELLLQAKLPEAVHDALLGKSGPYRNALQLAIAAEGQSPQELEQQATLCGLEAQQVSQCALRSLAWAHQVSTLENS